MRKEKMPEKPKIQDKSLVSFVSFIYEWTISKGYARFSVIIGPIYVGDLYIDQRRSIQYQFRHRNATWKHETKLFETLEELVLWLGGETI